MHRLAYHKIFDHRFEPLGGIHTIAAGMHYSPLELSEMMWLDLKSKEELGREYKPYIEGLDRRKNRWKLEAEKSEKTYDFLKRYIYD